MIPDKPLPKCFFVGIDYTWMILVEKLIHLVPVRCTLVMIVKLASDGEGDVTQYTTTVSAERAASEPHQYPFQTGSHRFASRFHQNVILYLHPCSMISESNHKECLKCCLEHKCCMLRIFEWNDIRTFAHLLRTSYGIVVWKLLKCRGWHVRIRVGVL
jgi:hypothetical protein